MSVRTNVDGLTVSPLAFHSICLLLISVRAPRSLLQSVIITDRSYNRENRIQVVKISVILCVLDIQGYAKANKKDRPGDKTKSCCMKFILHVPLSWNSRENLFRHWGWVATGVIFLLWTTSRAKQLNNMDYILTQTSMLKSETIVFNFIRVSLTVREALYDFTALYSLLSVSVSLSLPLFLSSLQHLGVLFILILLGS